MLEVTLGPFFAGSTCSSVNSIHITTPFPFCIALILCEDYSYVHHTLILYCVNTIVTVSVLINRCDVRHVS